MSRSFIAVLVVLLLACAQEANAQASTQATSFCFECWVIEELGIEACPAAFDSAVGCAIMTRYDQALCADGCITCRGIGMCAFGSVLAPAGTLPGTRLAMGEDALVERRSCDNAIVVLTQDMHIAAAQRRFLGKLEI